MISKTIAHLALIVGKLDEGELADLFLERLESLRLWQRQGLDNDPYVLECCEEWLQY